MAETRKEGKKGKEGKEREQGHVKEKKKKKKQRETKGIDGVADKQTVGWHDMTDMCSHACIIACASLACGAAGTRAREPTEMGQQRATQGGANWHATKRSKLC